MRKLNTSISNNKDTVLKSFWRDNAHFADLFNATVFNGKQVLSPDNLIEMDTESSAAIYSKNYLESIRRSRDIVKKMSQGIEYNILGLEIQDKIHYGMPLRTMTYDTLGYIKEYNDIRNRHKQNNDLCHTSESFLSGINKTDRFHPIITVVLYYGESYWDGPTCLSDMMTSVPDNIKPFFSDYKLNLIQILDSDKYTFYNKDVKNLFNITKDIYNKNLQSLYQYKNIDTEIIELVSAITDNPQLINLYNGQEKGGIDNMMCKAFQELKAEWAEEGLQAGKQQEKISSIISMLEFGVSKEQILTKYSKEELAKAEAVLESKP